MLDFFALVMVISLAFRIINFELLTRLVAKKTNPNLRNLNT